MTADNSTKSNLTIVFLGLDDTLYPKSCNIDVYVRDRITLYMKERLGLDRAGDLSYELYLKYGTTLKGLIDTGYKELAEPERMIEYYHFVHDLMYEGRIPHSDTKLRDMLHRVRARYESQGHTFRMVMFTNSDKRHCMRVLDHMGLRE